MSGSEYELVASPHWVAVAPNIYSLQMRYHKEHMPSKRRTDLVEQNEKMNVWGKGSGA
jgi:hypothetical protein